MNSILKLENICHKYLDDLVIDNFSLDVLEGEFVAITGVSGSGKSTLLNIMNMLIEPTSGNLIIDGVSNPKLNSEEGRELLHNTLGLIFQNNLLLESETVKENLSIYENATDYTIEDVLNIVNLPNFQDKYIYQLSGGEQQRIAIARTLLKQCKLILADEITGNLDKLNRDIIFDLLKELQNKGYTIVLVTHDMELAKLCDRIVKLDKN